MFIRDGGKYMAKETVKPKIHIAINGDEKYKSEIVYNNVMNIMNDKSITKEDQVEYFKEKLTLLEASRKNTFKQIIIFVVGFLLLALGLFLICIDFYTLGIIFSLISFILTVILIIKFTNNNSYALQSKKYEEIETLRKIIDSKIK